MLQRSWFRRWQLDVIDVSRSVVIGTGGVSGVSRVVTGVMHHIYCGSLTNLILKISLCLARIIANRAQEFRWTRAELEQELVNESLNRLNNRPAVNALCLMEFGAQKLGTNFCLGFNFKLFAAVTILALKSSQNCAPS